MSGYRRCAIVASSQMFSTTEADKVFVSEKSVEASVSLTSLTHEAGESDDGVLSTNHLSVFIDLANNLVR